ncbi:DUF4352 domain-containing protein [Enterococcus devriesei]|uniref:DUF4352 domain-containing protein n=1 Tax=Enterococcus devriesei TaxID=319970 RepID=UPI001C106F10|nr:DUF4352 domain-containing protein [Enterococcus devriesei]MBU5364859.1 DUF4352 domain-containing protein [Enterococcus devriesei]MDT2820262.1 DUF4352 domain-containing protein [Enterococcus devriesei]
MSKKTITEESGKQYIMTEKKPFYKKVVFWIFAIILIAVIGSSLGGNTDDHASDNGGEKVENSSKSSEKEVTETFYKVGDSVKVGNVTYTLNNVELTDQRNQFEEKQPAQVIKITYTVKNDDKQDIPVGADVEVYGPDDKKAETYANENTMGSVASGKQMDVTAHFALNQSGKIEIHFAPLISFEKAAKFKTTV